MWPPLKRALLLVALALAMGLVFMAYLRPAFMVELGNQILLCF